MKENNPFTFIQVITRLVVTHCTGTVGDQNSSTGDRLHDLVLEAPYTNRPLGRGGYGVVMTDASSTTEASQWQNLLRSHL